MLYITFEELPVWKEADTLLEALRPLIDAARHRRDYRFAEQLRGASLSIMNNIAEGFERKSMKEFVHHLSIAKGSAGEVRSMLHVARREKQLPEEEIELLINATQDVSRQLSQFMKYLQRRFG